MTLQEAMKMKGNPYWIPDAIRADLPAFFKSLGFGKGVEIGVSWAQNIIGYAEEGFEIYGIDPWDPNTDEDTFRKVISIPGNYGKSAEGVYRLAKERTEKYPNCHLIRKTSFDALEDFPDRSLDFVYIDGNHSFGYVAMDLMKWNRKVKKGGVIAGHDYYSTQGARGLRQIRHVVDAFAKAYDFENWYVLGTPESKRQDREFSFLFFKHW